MGVQFWQGLQSGPVLDSFKQIIHEWNTQQDAEQIAEEDKFHVELKDFTDYGAPVTEALSNPEDKQPCFVLAPEFTTSKMMDALKNNKAISIGNFLDQKQLDNVAEIVKRTFGDKDGHLASFPFGPSCGVIFINKDLLEKADIDPNYVPETLEDLERVGKTLIEKGLVEGIYTFAWPPAYSLEIPAAQQDLPIAEPDNGKLGFGRYQLEQDWIVHRLIDLRDQAKNKVLVYAGRDNNARKPFIEKKVAFFMQGSTHYSTLQKEAAFSVGCAPLPMLVRGQQVKYSFPLGGGSIWVLNTAKTQKMAKGVRAFLNYLASEDIQERWHKETGYVPVLQSLPNKLQDYYKDHPLHEAVASQTIGAKSGKYSFGIHMPNWDVARKELFNLIEAVVVSQASNEDIIRLVKEFDDKFSISQK
ncbi:MAG: extracellular solute-binding protein [Anaerolineae bacterium]